MKYINEFIKYKEYKGEKAIYRVNDNCGNTYYSDEYVNWLEEQLRIHDVIVSCPKCNSSWIGDIGYGNCECWMCGNVFKLKSKTGLEDN